MISTLTLQFAYSKVKLSANVKRFQFDTSFNYLLFFVQLKKKIGSSQKKKKKISKGKWEGRTCRLGRVREEGRGGGGGPTPALENTP